MEREEDRSIEKLGKRVGLRGKKVRELRVRGRGRRRESKIEIEGAEER